MTEPTTCDWSDDEDGNWSTDCGQMFWFDTGGPKENGFRFCPYCGASLRAETQEEEEEVKPKKGAKKEEPKKAEPKKADKKKESGKKRKAEEMI